VIARHVWSCREVPDEAVVTEAMSFEEAKREMNCQDCYDSGAECPGPKYRGEIGKEWYLKDDRLIPMGK